jgi:hypothetical protein
MQKTDELHFAEAEMSSWLWNPDFIGKSGVNHILFLIAEIAFLMRLTPPVSVGTRHSSRWRAVFFGAEHTS